LFTNSFTISQSATGFYRLFVNTGISVNVYMNIDKCIAEKCITGFMNIQYYLVSVLLHEYSVVPGIA